MLTQEARNRLPERLRHFTDRQEQVEAFDALWRGDAWILVFHGMSGQGKTTLIDFLVETRCRPHNIPYAWLDFGGDLGAPLRAGFRALADALVDASTLQLPRAATRSYAARRDRAWQHLQTRKLHIQIQAGISAEGGSQVSDSPLTVHGDVARAMRQLEHATRDEIGDALLDAITRAADRRAVIFLDTFELMAEEADPEQRAWLWGVLTSAHARRPGLRVVVGSRQPLDLEPRHGCQLVLNALSPQDSDRLLSRLEVDDPAWRAAVYERLAAGHPLLTEMAADLWRQARATGDPIPAGDIPHLAGHERAVAWLTGRILDRLAEPLKSAVRWAALLRRFDHDILTACLEPELPPLSADDYERLRRYSFVEPARGGPGYACHDLLRRVQTHYLRDNQPGAWRAFHTRAASYFSQRGDDLEALYHRLALADADAFDAWQGWVNRAAFDWDWPRWGALLDLAQSPGIWLSPAQEGSVWEKRGWWQYRRGQLDTALDSYRQAMALLQSAGDQAGLATSYNNMGLIFKARGDYDQALTWYQKSVAIKEKLGDQAGLATTLHNMGYVAIARRNLSLALDLFTQSRSIYARIGLSKDVAEEEAMIKQVQAALTQVVKGRRD